MQRIGKINALIISNILQSKRRLLIQAKNQG